jgi:hypothetical protein
MLDLQNLSNIIIGISEQTGIHLLVDWAYATPQSNPLERFRTVVIGCFVLCFSAAG